MPTLAELPAETLASELLRRLAAPPPAAPAPAGDDQRGRTIAVDFDGVIHAYRDGWRGGEIYDDPEPGALEALEKLMRRYCVCIFSSRPPAAIVAWMSQVAQGLPCEIVPEDAKFWEKRGVLGVTNRKLPFAVIIDDRAERYTGNWRDILNRHG